MWQWDQGQEQDDQGVIGSVVGQPVCIRFYGLPEQRLGKPLFVNKCQKTEGFKHFQKGHSVKERILKQGATE